MRAFIEQQGLAALLCVLEAGDGALDDRVAAGVGHVVGAVVSTGAVSSGQGERDLGALAVRHRLVPSLCVALARNVRAGTTHGTTVACSVVRTLWTVSRQPDCSQLVAAQLGSAHTAVRSLVVLALSLADSPCQGLTVHDSEVPTPVRLLAWLCHTDTANTV